MFLKFLESSVLKKVCLASNRMVQMFRADPNLPFKKAKLLLILHSKNLRFLPWDLKRKRRNYWLCHLECRPYTAFWEWSSLWKSVWCFSMRTCSRECHLEVPDSWSGAELDNNYSKVSGGNATLPFPHQFCTQLLLCPGESKKAPHLAFCSNEKADHWLHWSDVTVTAITGRRTRATLVKKKDSYTVKV